MASTEKDKQSVKITQVSKKDLTNIAQMYLKSYGINMSKSSEILPVINALFFTMNELLKNGISINIRNFGSFYVVNRTDKRKNITLKGKEFAIKKQRYVKFKYTNKTFK